MVNTRKMCSSCGPVETRYSNCPRCWGPVRDRRAPGEPPAVPGPTLLTVDPQQRAVLERQMLDLMFPPDLRVPQSTAP